MAEFFQDVEEGVNAFAIVMNAQAARFDQQLQKMLKIANRFFNDPNFWNHVCIVFTRAYPMQPIEKPRMEGRFRQEIINLIGDCLRERQRVLEREPTLPVFFVDSPRWQTDTETAAQLEVMREFIDRLRPLSTRCVVVPDPKYLFIMREHHAIRSEVPRVNVARKDYKRTQAEVGAIMGDLPVGGAVLGIDTDADVTAADVAAAGVGVGPDGGVAQVGAVIGASLGGGAALGVGVGAAVGFGAEIGAAAGVVGGPIGIAIGAAVGVGFGAIVGGITWAVRRNEIVAVKVTTRHIEENRITRVDYEGNTEYDCEIIGEWDEVQLVPSK
jgi:hypothetical protein